MNKTKINDVLTDHRKKTCSQLEVMVIQQKYEFFTLHKKSPNTEFFCSVFSRIWTEYDDL